MLALLEQKERIINAIANEKDAIAVESNSLEQQIDSLKDQCQTVLSFGINEVINLMKLIRGEFNNYNLKNHLQAQKSF